MSTTDPVLPGLALALNFDAIEALLRGKLVLAEGLAVVGGRVWRVRYEPGKSCSIIYRIELEDQSSGARRQEIITGKLLSRGENPAPIAHELLEGYEKVPRRAICSPVIYLPEAYMVLYAFPLDPALPQLLDALDTAKVREDLSAIGLEQGWQVNRIIGREPARRSLAYIPETRATLYYKVDASSAPGNEQHQRGIVAKFYQDQDPAKVFGNMWAVWQAAEGRSVNLAGPIGYSQDLRLVFQEHIQGAPLSTFSESPIFSDLVEAAATGIATIHSLELPLTRERTPEFEARFIPRWADTVSAILPAQAAKIERLKNRLTTEVYANTRPIAPIHGDFHPSNCLVREGRVNIIDTDDVAWG
ncbi:MAG: phosphotransferase, partial [Dehalococcoidia bacterium]